MIWRYPYFRKPPNINPGKPRMIYPRLIFLSDGFPNFHSYFWHGHEVAKKIAQIIRPMECLPKIYELQHLWTSHLLSSKCSEHTFYRDRFRRHYDLVMYVNVKKPLLTISFFFFESFYLNVLATLRYPT